MNIINKTNRIICFICLVIIFLATFQARAQEKLPTFIYDGEEYEAMPYDEYGSLTWWNATERCTNYQVYGHSDWFIPDIDQLRALYAHQNAIGGFTDNWYWSSTPNGRYSSVVLDFKTGQSFPESNNSRAVKCRYIRKTGRAQKTQSDYSWIYGEWIGKYRYYHYVWKEAYMVVSITPNRLVVTDAGKQIYDGGYVVKDDLIEYIPYHNPYGWIGSDVWGFLEIMPISHQLGSGYNRVLDKYKSYNHQQSIDQKKEPPKNAIITIESNECEIFVDGKSFGKNRWVGNLEKGNHTVKVIRDCFEPHEEIITVQGGEDKTFSIVPLRLKQRKINIICNVGEATAVVDGEEMRFDHNGLLSLELDMQDEHVLEVSAPKYAPLTISFFVLENEVVCKTQEGLSSYKGEQSTLVGVDLSEITIQLKKYNKNLYYGDDPKYKYSGPLIGVDNIRISGFSVGSEIAYFREYCLKSRFCFSGSIGVALMPENNEASSSFLSNTEYEIPSEFFVGLSLGWQMFSGSGLRLTPQVGVLGYSLFDEPYAALCAKVNVAYPITKKLVVGATPMVGYMVFENPFWNKNKYFGFSLTLGWQKRQ